jgi:hypothetical protein
MSPPLQPYEPSSSSPAFQLDVLSDPPSLIKDDLEAIEKTIFEQDVPTPLRNTTSKNLPLPVDDYSSSETYPGDTTVRLSDIYSPMASLEGETPPSGKITTSPILVCFGNPMTIFWSLCPRMPHSYRAIDLNIP